MSDEERYNGLRKHSKEINGLTKQCLKEALLLLMKEKTYRDITVTELCKKAGLSRMAFYRNYDVVNDILQEIAGDLIVQVLALAGSPFRTTSTKQWYSAVFEYVSENRNTVSVMFQEDFQFEWIKLVNQVAVPAENISAEERYFRLMWSGGFENVLAYWLKTDLKEKPEELAEYCEKYLPHPNELHKKTHSYGDLMRRILDFFKSPR